MGGKGRVESSSLLRKIFHLWYIKQNTTARVYKETKKQILNHCGESFEAKNVDVGKTMLFAFEHSTVDLKVFKR
jgi:hypothetical protein